MTYNTPLRLMCLHDLQIFLTDARTFIFFPISQSFLKLLLTENFGKGEIYLKMSFLKTSKFKVKAFGLIYTLFYTF